MNKLKRNVYRIAQYFDLSDLDISKRIEQLKIILRVKFIY